MDDDLPFTYSEEEFGELLFSLVCRARQNGLDAERACAPIPVSLLSTTNSLVTAEAGESIYQAPLDAIVFRI